MTPSGVQEQLAGGAVLYETSSDGVAIVTLNRPSEMNAVSLDLQAGWFDAYDRAVADSAVRVIVVTGAGRAWCAGASLADLSKASAKPSSDAASEKANAGLLDRRAELAKDESMADGKGRPMNYAIYVPKPIIAAINGACAGLGFAQAMFCDMRFAVEGSKFTSAFARRGLIAEFGVSGMLPRAVGIGNAMDVLLSGRTFLADEALRLGVVQRVFPADGFMSEVLAYATDMATKASPTSMSIIKQQVWRHSLVDPDVALRESNRLMVESTSLRNPDFREGVLSFLERRPPEFAPVDFGCEMQLLRRQLFEERTLSEGLRRALEAARRSKL